MWHSSLSQASYEPFSLLTRRANKVVRTYCTKRTEHYYSIRKLTLSMNTGSFFLFFTPWTTNSGDSSSYPLYKIHELSHGPPCLPRTQKHTSISTRWHVATGSAPKPRTPTCKAVPPPSHFSYAVNVSVDVLVKSAKASCCPGVLIFSV
jgi:hypothetical protein